MVGKSGFVDSNLIKIKDKLATTSLNIEGERKKMPSETSSEQTSSELRQKFSQAPTVIAAQQIFHPPLPSPAKNELRLMIEKRKNEFKLLKRDVSEKLCEKISSISEDIKITSRRGDELKNAAEKFASILDEIKNMDESLWNDDTPQSEIGRACKTVENARLEYIRINARLSTLQRESTAAEMDTKSNPSIIPELASLSLKQGFRIGLFICLPLIIIILFSAIIICAAYLLALR
jgi:hypothetical protein